MNKIVGYALAGMALACASCTNSNNLYPVSGTVTYKGKPAAGAAVFFHRQRGDPMKEHAIMGLVQEDGSFTLVCGHLGPGAPPGEYDVLIEWRQPPGQAKGQAQGGPGLRRKAPDRLKGRYADPRRPLLRAGVKAEPNELPPFALTD